MVTAVAACLFEPREGSAIRLGKEQRKVKAWREGATGSVVEKVNGRESGGRCALRDGPELFPRAAAASEFTELGTARRAQGFVIAP